MKRKYLVLTLVFFLLLALDQASKLSIERHFLLHESRGIVPGFFSITHIQNSGAAFGMLANIPQASIVLIFISLIAIFLILTYIRQIREEEVWTPFALALVLTGAAGNLIDRFRLGRVVDFLDFYYKEWHWPAFNVADASITIGVILLAIKVLQGGKKVTRAKR